MGIKSKELLDPRQQLALENYTNPKSKTFGNRLRSMMSAGYDEDYCRTLAKGRPQWLSDHLITRVNMIKKAERNLNKFLDIEIDINDPNIKREQIDLLKIKNDVSKFVAKTLAKAVYNDGEDEKKTGNFTINITQYKGDNDKVIKDIEPEE